jgi:hypothetical protein
MSKPSHRPNGEALKAQRAERRRQQKALRKRQREQGLAPHPTPSLANTVSPYATLEQEDEARHDAATDTLGVLRSQLPFLLERLGRIPDPRQPGKVKHQLTLVLLYGLLSLVFQLGSRREVNRTMTAPRFMDNLKRLFPQLDSLPHADTLFRLLAEIDIAHIETLTVDLIKRFIRNKKFQRYLVNNGYPVAIDGTQKWTLDRCWSEQALKRQTSGGDSQFYVYVLQANLAFSDGMTLPLLTEFLETDQGDSERNKQDCEQRAFHRLAKRLKKLFPRLPIIVLLDGLYANGPVMARCREFNWQFMIVLKDACLPSVWDEVRGLAPLQPNHHHCQTWGDRRQHFWWVNDIAYEFGDSQRLTVHVVVCEERWETVGDSGTIEPRSARHVWLSSRPLNRDNVHTRCNLGARHRWNIEAGILVEKRCGYYAEHRFSYNWNAMKGHHLLMRLAVLLNTLARFTRDLAPRIAARGMRPWIAFVRETFAAWPLDPERIAARLARPFQLRLE